MNDENCNMNETEEFKRDLHHLMNCWDSNSVGLCDDEQYDKAYEYFVHRWGPK